MSGWGRTGKWFAVDNWDVVPDMITTAKGITSGYVPLGAVIVSEPIADYFEDRMLWCGLTYNGHPLACAAAVATIEVYKDDRLIENATTVGKYLGEQLEKIKQDHQCVGDVRYIGLFSVIELVRNESSKQPLPTEIMSEIGKYLRANGVFTYLMSSVMGSMVFVVPPLCITESQLAEGLRVIDEALKIGDQAYQ
jgi:taurine--2-oxoglutarate transaminase